MADVDVNGSLFTGENNYRLVFAADAIPPATSFWSLVEPPL